MQHNQGVPASPSGYSAEPEPSSTVSAVPVSIPNAAPWWRCLHCGCDEYEDHVFTGHMKGVPMVHCANCKALHSQPDPNSKTALRWQISELAEALIDWRNTYLCPCSDLDESATRLLSATDAILETVGIEPYASAIEAFGQDGVTRLDAKHESAVAKPDAQP